MQTVQKPNQNKTKRTSFLGDCRPCVCIMILEKESVNIWVTSVVTLFPVGLRAQVP